MEGAAGRGIPEQRKMGCPGKNLAAPFPRQSRIS